MILFINFKTVFQKISKNLNHFKKKKSKHKTHAYEFYDNKNKTHIYVFYIKHVHFMDIEA